MCGRRDAAGSASAGVAGLERSMSALMLPAGIALASSAARASDNQQQQQRVSCSEPESLQLRYQLPLRRELALSSQQQQQQPSAGLRGSMSAPLAVEPSVGGRGTHAPESVRIRSVVEVGTVALSTNVSTTDADLQAFLARTAPGISIDAYLNRLERYSVCGAGHFVVLLCLLDRLEARWRGLLAHNTAHRLVLSAFLVTLKMYADQYPRNDHMARVGGVPTVEMNRLERAFLRLLDYDLLLSVSEYDGMLDRLEWFSRGVVDGGVAGS
jgi:hypothetical protein